MDITVPIVSFLITADDPDDDTAILVDTGMHAPNEDGKVRGREVENTGPEPIVEGLAEQDLEPDDIDYVIITHLHHDHCSNNRLFSEAEFFVQRAELEAAKNPIPPNKSLYYDDDIASLEDVDLTVIDGGYRLRDGLEMILTPGHTKGMQSLIVQTADGPVGLISDLAYCQHNIYPQIESFVDGRGRVIEPTRQPDLDYIAPGIHVDVEDCYVSIDRIKERVDGGLLIAGHDAEILGEPIP
jgi:hypothetical protein